MSYFPLQPVGGGAAAQLQVGPSTTVITPVLTTNGLWPTGGPVHGGRVTLAVTCATAGATIYYAVEPLGTTPVSGAWISNTTTPIASISPLQLSPPGTLFTASSASVWVYATKAGMTASAPVRYDVWYTP